MVTFSTAKNSETWPHEVQTNSDCSLSELFSATVSPFPTHKAVQNQFLWRQLRKTSCCLLRKSPWRTTDWLTPSQSHPVSPAVCRSLTQHSHFCHLAMCRVTYRSERQAGRSPAGSSSLLPSSKIISKIMVTTTKKVCVWIHATPVGLLNNVAVVVCLRTRWSNFVRPICPIVCVFFLSSL